MHLTGWLILFTLPEWKTEWANNARPRDEIRIWSFRTPSAAKCSIAPVAHPVCRRSAADNKKTIVIVPNVGNDWFFEECVSFHRIFRSGIECLDWMWTVIWQNRVFMHDEVQANEQIFLHLFFLSILWEFIFWLCLFSKTVSPWKWQDLEPKSG